MAGLVLPPIYHERMTSISICDSLTTFVPSLLECYESDLDPMTTVGAGIQLFKAATMMTDQRDISFFHGFGFHVFIQELDSQLPP